MPQSQPPSTEAEAVEALRERVAAAELAARRLVDEATKAKPPAAGWDVPPRADRAQAEIEALVRLAGVVRDVLPAELQAQLSDLVRQLLLLVRAVVDLWIERLAPAERDEPDGAPQRPVEDIPIS